MTKAAPSDKQLQSEIRSLRAEIKRLKSGCEKQAIAARLVTIEHDLLCALGSASGLKEGIERLLRAALKIEGIDCGGVYLTDRKTGALNLVCHQNVGAAFIQRVACFAPGSSELILAMKGKAFHDTKPESPDVNKALKAEGIRSIGVIPVRCQREVVACMTLASHTSDEIPRVARRALEAIGASLGGLIARFQWIEALEQRDELYRAMFEGNQAVKLLIDPEDGRIVDANPAACRFYRYSYEKITQLRITDISELPPARVRESIRRIPKEGKSYGVFPHRLATGETRTVEAHSSPIPFRGRTLLFSIIHDVTERHRAETEARRSQEHFAKAFRSSPDGLVMSRRRDGLIIDLNDSMLQMLGYAREEVIGKTSTELGIFEHELDRQRAADVFDKTGRLRDFEMRVRRRTGEMRDVLLSAEQIDIDGEPCILSTIRDITARKNAEREIERLNRDLHHRVNELETLLKVIPLGIGIISDPEKRSLRFNPCFARMLGVSRTASDPLLALSEEQTAAFRIYRDGRELSPHDWPMRRSAAEGIELRDVEIEVRHEDGRVANLLEFASPLHDEHGCLRGSVGVFLDISERKRTEENLREIRGELERHVQIRTAELAEANARLREEIEEHRLTETALRVSEEQFRQMAENLSEVFWVSTPRMEQIKYASPAFDRIWGQPSKNLLANPRVWLDAIVRSDQPMVEASLRANQFGRATEDEFRILRPDGAIRWIRNRAFPLSDAGGEVHRVVGVAEDITDRKLAEQALERNERRFRQFAEVSLEGIAFHERGIIADANEALLHMFGRARFELIGKSRMVLIAPEARERSRAAFASCATSGGPMPPIDSVGLRKDGTVFPIEIAVRAIPYHGRVVQVLIFRDVSEQSRLQQELLRRQEETARFQRLSTIGELASGLAHELNQPLAAIANYARGCVRRLESGRIDAAQLGEAMTHVAQQSERAGEIIRRLRGLVRTHEPQRSTIRVNPIANRAASFMEAAAREGGISVRMQLAEGLPPIQADELQIEQVLLNLVRNACEAMLSANSPMRLLTVQTRLASPQVVEIAVSDTGPGLPPEVARRPFEGFITTKPTGLGMGLAICRSIVEAHGGKLSVDANSGPGVTFSIRLPIGGED